MGCGASAGPWRGTPTRESVERLRQGAAAWRHWADGVRGPQSQIAIDTRAERLLAWLALADFSCQAFPRAVDFSAADLPAVASFAGAAVFEHASFGRHAQFEHARFAATLRFKAARFFGTCHFDDAMIPIVERPVAERLEEIARCFQKHVTRVTSALRI